MGDDRWLAHLSARRTRPAAGRRLRLPAPVRCGTLTSRVRQEFVRERPDTHEVRASRRVMRPIMAMYTMVSWWSGLVS